ncbi:PREDICTED: guanine nucleotide-binding protein G(I)/G(S)/G(O) subunit gamma-11-like, partial [Fulmarus glacialis]|uniref:guanine nucleotide-binding protein G(I)/G(S)/G(O) subunit gamma-11-like n=1 Tax=Fulmarus glacialis TaxID=30455 RepID=UPI00051C9042
GLQGTEEQGTCNGIRRSKFFFAVRQLEVSKCSEEIKNYIEERSGEDPLVKGVPEDKNPFKEKGGCVIA